MRIEPFSALRVQEWEKCLPSSSGHHSLGYCTGTGTMRVWVGILKPACKPVPVRYLCLTIGRIKLYLLLDLAVLQHRIQLISRPFRTSDTLLESPHLPRHSNTRLTLPHIMLTVQYTCNLSLSVSGLCCTFHHISLVPAPISTIVDALEFGKPSLVPSFYHFAYAAVYFVSLSAASPSLCCTFHHISLIPTPISMFCASRCWRG